ncbi:cholesterol esterase [Quaeritorhiza haematococci]|nr:cholesterol esterase [Quaeritorhiza haematococci]
MANNRCVYPKHATLNVSSDEFWDFSLDALAQYDVPALVEHILKETNRPQVIYVGHSQGTAQMFMALSSNPKLNQQIAIFIALAPATYIGLKFPTSFLISRSTVADYNLIFGRRQFVPLMVQGRILVQRWFFVYLGDAILSFLLDVDNRSWNPQFKKAYYSFTPLPVSAKMIRHWGVIAGSKTFRRYGDGTYKAKASKKDLENGRDPLEYNLRNIKAPVALFYGDEDRLCEGKAAEEMCTKAKVNLVFSRCIKRYDHLCPLWACDAKEKVWRHVLRLADVASR